MSHCVCKAPRIQAIGQLDENDQDGDLLAVTFQSHASNSWAPDRKKSPGHNGGRKQTGKDVATDGMGNWSMSDHETFRGR